MYKKFRRGHMTEDEYDEALMRLNESTHRKSNVQHDNDDQIERSCKRRSYGQNVIPSLRKDFRRKKLLKK